MKKYINIKPNDSGITDIEVEVYYSLGGYNVFTYKEEARGYYIRVCPVKRERKNGYAMVSYEAFSGRKKLLLEVKRRGKKSEEKAEELAVAVEKELVDSICVANSLEIA